MKESTYTVLGSSSGFPQADRATSGYLLKIGNELTLIDCGGGVTSSFLRRGHATVDVRQIVISHCHPDHCCELPLFIQHTYLSKRTSPLDIYLPVEFVSPFTAYLNALYLFPATMPFELNINGYEDGFILEREFKLRAIGNRHLHAQREKVSKLDMPNLMQCHSFQIEVNDRKLFHSADIASFDDIRDHLPGNNIVVTEMTHIDVEEFMNQAVASDVEEFVFTHLGDSSELARLTKEAERAGLQNYTFAVDGLEIEL